MICTPLPITYYSNSVKIVTDLSNIEDICWGDNFRSDLFHNPLIHLDYLHNFSISQQTIQGISN
jgi:hypothetical protein